MKKPVTRRTSDRIISMIDRQARQGNWRWLILHLEHRGEVTEPLYDLLLAILRGQVRRRRGREKDLATHYRNVRMFIEVWDLRQAGLATEPAVAEVAAKYRVSQRAVYNAMKNSPGAPDDTLRKLSRFPAR
jgi:hypothetical protein